MPGGGTRTRDSGQAANALLGLGACPGGHEDKGSKMRMAIPARRMAVVAVLTVIGVFMVAAQGAGAAPVQAGHA